MVILLSKALLLHREHTIVNEATAHKLCHSLQLGARVVYKQGLLRKGVGLCHGVAGNVFALLAASDALDSTSTSPRSSVSPPSAVHFSVPSEPTSSSDESNRRRRYFTKAAHLAFLGKFHDDPSVLPEMGTPDHPWSLFEGLAGMCCAWAEVLSRMDERNPKRERSGFPGYDDL